jgi:hypothetical protein
MMQLVRMRQIFLAVAVVLAAASPAFAEEAAPAPDVDGAIQKMLELDPATLAEKLKAMREQAAAKEAEAKQFSEQAAAKEAEAKAAQASLEKIMAGLKALDLPTGTPDEKKDEAKMMEGAPMAMAAAPAPEEETNAEEAAGPPKVTFAEHIEPIFKAACANCHNRDRQRGGLNAADFGALLEGGSSGQVIMPGDPDGSRLFRLVQQTEEPKMPPSGPPLSEEQLNLLREWIQLGAPENAGSKVMVAEKIEVSEDVFVAAAVSDGPPPMPEVELEKPVIQAARGVVARAIATSPTAPLVAIGAEKQVVLYNLEDYSVLGVLPFPEGEIFTITFSVNGELLLAAGGQGGDSGIAVLWNVRTAERIGTYGEAYDTILAADISPDHRMLALGGPNRIVRTYNVADGAERFTCDQHTDWIYSVKFTPDGELLATADRAGNLFLWQAANGRAVEQLRGHEGAIHDLDYTLDSKILASAGEDGTVQYWDTWKYSRIRSVNAHSGAVLSLDVSKDGEIVSSGVDGQTKRWDLNGAEVGKYAQLPDWAYQARFANGGQVVLGGDWHGQVNVWDRATGEERAVLNTLAAEPKITAVAKAEPAEAETEGAAQAKAEETPAEAAPAETAATATAQ